MRGRDKYCITVSGTTNEEQWIEIRDVLGPTPGDQPNLTTVSGNLMEADIAAYDSWVASYGLVPFDKWLIWKIRIGTDRYGNLPADKRHDGDKVGHCWAPCPYSTQSSEIRTRHLLGLGSNDPLPVKVDHEAGGITYYMQTTSRGNRWGFACPHIGCTYFILTGEKYFYA